MTRIAVCSSLTEIATANYFVRAFKNLGHDTVALSDINKSVVDVEISSFDYVGISLNRIKFTPDLFLFIEGGSMQLFPRGLQSLSCLTAWYGIDTHMAYEKHLCISKLFDVTFVAQKQYVNRLRADGIKNVFWLPLGFDSSILPVEPLERIHDVSFVGSNDPRVHPERGAYIKQISESFPNHLFVSSATPVEMGGIYAQSKIVFNKSVNNDLNMRYFEALGAGACLVTDPIIDNGVDDIFKRGEDFFEYEDDKSLLKVIEKLLTNPLLMDQVSERVRRKILENHTYDHRAVQILEATKRVEKLKPPNFLDYFAVYIYLGLFPLALSAAAYCFSINRKLGPRKLVESSLIMSILVFLACVAKAGLVLNNLIRRIYGGK